jgi:hypothetical protein
MTLESKATELKASTSARPSAVVFSASENSDAVAASFSPRTSSDSGRNVRSAGGNAS